MATVYIPENTPQTKRAELRELLDRKLYFDPNWNGASFTIETHEHASASVDCDDGMKGAALLTEINDVLLGEAKP